MKRLLILLVTLALTLTLAACGDSGVESDDGGGSSADQGAEGGGATGGGESSDDSDYIATVEDFKAALERDHGDTDWFADITDITIETYLGAQVMVVHVPYSTADADFDAINTKRTAISDALLEYDYPLAPNHAILDGDNAIWAAGSGGGGVPMQEAFELPEAPQTAEEVKAWIDTVYGPGGVVQLGDDENWYEAIESVRYEDPGYGTGNVLFVKTNLPTYRDVRGPLIERALHTSGSPLIVNYVIEVDDGSGPSGGIGGTEGLAPGYNGWFIREK